MTTPSCLRAVAGAAALLVPASLAAQARDTVPLPAIVITAARLPVPLARTTSAVTVLDGAALRARGLTQVAEALREVPGMTVVQSGGPGTVTSLFLRGGESDYVRVLVDGIPVNQPGGAVDLAGLSLDNVERIEIVRGPASVLYGSDAVAGVVHVLTRHGGGPTRVGGAVRGGTRGTTTASAEAVGTVGGLGWSAGASRSASDGVYDLNSRWTSRSAAGALRGARGRADVALTARAVENDLRYPTDFTGAPTDSNQYSAGEERHAGLDAGFAWSPRVETRFQLGWHRGVLRTENAPDSPAETDGSRNDTRFTRRNADLRTTLRMGGTATVMVGAALERQDFRNALEFTGSFPGGDTVDAGRTNRAAYVQVLLALGERVSVTAGHRAEDYRQTGAGARALQSAGTSRVGATVRLGAATRLRGTYGTAFKEPTFFEQLGGGFSTGNPALVPERSRGYDLGAEQTLLGGRAVVGVTWFDQRFRDLVQYSFAVAPGAPNYTNIGEARARGAELEGRLQIAARSALQARYTRLTTVVTDSGVNGSTFAQGRRLLRRPTHSGSAALEHGVGARTRLDLTVLVVGGRDDLDFVNVDPVTFQPRRVTLPAYARLDAAVAVDLLRRGAGLVLTLRAENLTNERYEEVLSYPAPGRTVLVGLRAGGSH